VKDKLGRWLPRVTVDLAISGEVVDEELVTQTAGVAPTQFIKKGSHFGALNRVSPWTIWRHFVVARTSDIATPAAAALSSLKDPARLRELCAELSLCCELTITVTYADFVPELRIPSTLLETLVQLGSDLALDVIQVDDMEDLPESPLYADVSAHEN
jgi:hypothetical protein